ncbi:MAG: tripartite tricarboxylate transporter TctB family protein [Geminicoccaceae bacterium]|nr:tripartite tricarboxylate transporter TctB family protein [Geminicoccaceae bacterium]
MRVNDAITGAVLIVFAALMIGYAQTTFPSMPGQDYGPALFPTLIGAGFVVSGLILIAGGLVRRRRFEPWFEGGAWFNSPHHLACFGAVIGGLLIYILVSDWFGFIPTMVVLLTGWLVLFRDGRWISSAVIAVLVTLVINYAFTQFLLVPLPLGLLQPIIY